MQKSNTPKNIAICHVQVPFIRGGAEVLVDELTKNLKDRGHNVDVIRIPFQWNPQEKIIENAMIWRMLDIDVSNILGRPIDMVICTKFPAYLVNHPNKVLWLFHQYREAYELCETHYNSFNTEDGKRIKSVIRDLDNRFIPEADKVFTISKNVSNRLKKYNKIDSTPIYPGLKNAEDYYCGKFDDYVLFVSRMTAIKRPEILIKSIKYVKDKSLKFIFVGKDECGYLNVLMDMVKEEGVEDRVIFKSNYIPEKELLALYANALSVVFTPYDEDYGYITLEAFSSSKPVITTTDSGGPLEFVKHGKNGFVLKPKDFKGIAKHIDIFAKDREKAKKMGLKGCETVKDITWDNAISKLLNEE